MAKQLRRQRITMPTSTGLDVIAYQLFGDPGNFREIAEINHLDIFSALPVGEQIEVPTKDEILEQIKSAVKTTLSNYIDEKLDLSRLKQSEQFAYRLIDWII